jgi:hypothetical protein
MLCRVCRLSRRRRLAPRPPRPHIRLPVPRLCSTRAVSPESRFVGAGPAFRRRAAATRSAASLPPLLPSLLLRPQLPTTRPRPLTAGSFRLGHIARMPVLLSPDQIIEHQRFKELLASLQRSDLPDLPVPTGEAAETWKVHKSLHGSTRSTFQRDPADPIDNEGLSVSPRCRLLSDQRDADARPLHSSSATTSSSSF